MVTLQPKALEHVIGLMKEGGLTPDSHNLRVGVKGGDVVDYLTQWILMIR